LPSTPPAAAAVAAPRPALSPGEIYSRRALRRARLLIQMQMLELREQRLECVERAIRRNLPAVLRDPAGKDNAVKPEDSRDVIYRSNRLLYESETCAWMSDRPRRPRRPTA
jgi:hypothetical protein